MNLHLPPEREWEIIPPARRYAWSDETYPEDDGFGERRKEVISRLHVTEGSCSVQQISVDDSGNFVQICLNNGWNLTLDIPITHQTFIRSELHSRKFVPVR